MKKYLKYKQKYVNEKNTVYVNTLLEEEHDNMYIDHKFNQYEKRIIHAIVNYINNESKGEVQFKVRPFQDSDNHLTASTDINEILDEIYKHLENKECILYSLQEPSHLIIVYKQR